MNRLYFGDNLKWLSDRKEFSDHDKDYPRIQILTVENLLNGSERVDAPPQLNPFAIAARESATHKQPELL
jgi:hypothetical protein